MTRIALVSLAIAGMVGLAACSDNTENGDAATEEETGQEEPADNNGEESGDNAAENADETITVEAGDLYYEGIPDTLPAGTIAIELENVGDMPHDLVIEELDDEMVVEQIAGGTSASGTVELEPGEYTIYCSIGNHRAQGMEETITVE